ncbi:hypothetical protein GCM10009425_45480 [Pseudomonas asuensis]|uniref:Uncharacterized protein n=1 Tax=Pseudomonas asuensis TaxID=1825787 RepID=A0ABQ2H3Z1_9PSED|nr:hypothetical protein GCM10009425_45480 [Pseudomonas asuensis]
MPARFSGVGSHRVDGSGSLQALDRHLMALGSCALKGAARLFYPLNGGVYNGEQSGIVIGMAQKTKSMKSVFDY